jgi:glycosyltransferase involved in cell wall biosynthesis
MLSLHVDTARTWRGGQHQLLLTLAGLRARGHRVALAARPDGALAARVGEIDLAAAWRLSRAIRALAPDVVHAHDSHALAVAATALSMASAPRRPLVMSRRVDFRLKRNAFSRWKYRQVDCFLCASEAIRRLLVADGVPLARTRVVHDGVDLAHVDAAPVVDVREAFGLPAAAKIAGNVAALVPHKGQRHLVEAAAIVVRRRPDVHFVIVGEGELRAPLQRQIRALQLHRHVLLAGFRPDALGLCKSFDLFVMSSVMEGLGSAILEAMACRRAVAATAAGGIPEVVVHGETGLLVPPRDDAALAEAVLLLLDDAERRAAMGEAGRARVARAFSVDRMIDGVLESYQTVCATAAGRRA